MLPTLLPTPQWWLDVQQFGSAPSWPCCRDSDGPLILHYWFLCEAPEGWLGVQVSGKPNIGFLHFRLHFPKPETVSHHFPETKHLDMAAEKHSQGHHDLAPTTSGQNMDPQRMTRYFMAKRVKLMRIIDSLVSLSSVGHVTSMWWILGLRFNTFAANLHWWRTVQTLKVKSNLGNLIRSYMNNNNKR